VRRVFPVPARSRPEALRVEALLAIEATFEQPPVFFSSGDSSLLLFSRNRSVLEPFFRRHLADAKLVEHLV